MTAEKKHERMKVPILVPLAVALLLLLGSFVLSIHWFQKSRINKELQTRLDGVESLFKEELHKDSLMLSGLLDFIKNDKELQKAWLAKDRDALLQIALPIFESIKQKYRVTHFYFHQLDKICFLRVHNPAKYGDTISRFTLKKAAETGGTVFRN